MFSEEFMRYLINYQKSEPKKVEENKTVTIPFESSNRCKKLATILLTAKK